jgi:hypothetical protein
MPILIRELNFGKLRFQGDPQNAANRRELKRQGEALGEAIMEPRNARCFGLTLPGDTDKRNVTAGPPVVESVRSSRRVGPQGQIVFDLVAEVIQEHILQVHGRPLKVYGGATIILGPRGEVRYTIFKRATQREMVEEHVSFIGGDGAEYFQKTEGGWQPKPQLLNLLHTKINGRPRSARHRKIAAAE